MRIQRDKARQIRAWLKLSGALCIFSMLGAGVSRWPVRNLWLSTGAWLLILLGLNIGIVSILSRIRASRLAARTTSRTEPLPPMYMVSLGILGIMLAGGGIFFGTEMVVKIVGGFAGGMMVIFAGVSCYEYSSGA